MTSATGNQLVRGYGARLRQLASQRPDESAITLLSREQTRSVSWEQLYIQSGSVATYLREQGCVAGSRIALQLPNTVAHPLACLAAWRLGACILPVSYQMPDDELGAVLEIYSPQLVIEQRVDPAKTRWTCVGEDAIMAALDRPPAEDLPDVVAQPGLVIASGGSSGRPKLIVDPRAWGYRDDEAARMAATGFGVGLTILIAGPLYHTSPFTWLHKGLVVGNHVVLLERFDAELTLDAIERFDVGYFPTIPTVMSRLLRSSTLARRDLSSIRSLYHTGGPCPAAVKRRWIDILGPDRVFESYGSTENLGPTRIRGDEWLAHPGSVGVPTVPTLILADDGSPVDVGVVGKIFQRPLDWETRRVTYLGGEAAEENADGYVSVGDYGHLDADGYLYLSDRRLDMIVSGGANVYPAEVEAVLTDHPDVADAAVVGIPDPEWGNVVHAVIELVPGREWKPIALVEFARARLSAYKLPKSFTQVERLPRADSGKLRRRDVRALLPDGGRDRDQIPQERQEVLDVDKP